MQRVCKAFGIVILILTFALTFQARTCLFAATVEGQVNINTASETQIALLPGIGPKLAAEIVKHRVSYGDFKTIDDLKKIKGVGDKKFAKIKGLIIVEGDTTIKSTKKAGTENRPERD